VKTCLRTVAAAFLSVLFVEQAIAQALRFSNHRDVAIPDYATVRIGPFYSTVKFSQSAGYRWTRTRGAGTDFLFNNERGRIKKDGSEFPLISRLDFRNYLIISRNADVDVSISAVYAYYPLDTQEDELDVNLIEEGITANLSTAFRLNPYLVGTLYDRFSYRTDYIDTRGWSDEFGGSEYERLENTVGVDLDWLLARNKNLGASLFRTDVIPQDDEFEDQERVTYGEGLIYQQEILPGLIAGAGTTFYQNDYKSSEREDTDIQDYSFFLNFSRDAAGRLRLTRATSVSLAAGYARGAVAGRRRDPTREEVEEREEEPETITGSVELETLMRRDLTQTIRYGRAMRTGFSSNFEVTDTYRYELDWRGDLVSARAYSQLTEVDPSNRDETDYSDWTSGLTVTYPLVNRPYITLNASTRYSVRDNSARGITVVTEPEQENDYETWDSRIGTSFGIARDISFTTYVQHIERFSDYEDLQYERDIFAAYFTYSHQF